MWKIYFLVEDLPEHESREHIFTKLKGVISEFNLFPSVPPSNNEYELKNERISTRLFLLLLFVITTVLLLYTSLTTITKTVNIETPNLTQYMELYNKHPQTLTCPCSKISISYGDIVSIRYTLHQICSSDFIREDWIKYLSEYVYDFYWYPNDFHSISGSIFRGARALCELVNTTISQSLSQFYSSEYISGFVISPELLQSQIQASTAQFRTSTTINFLLSFSVIRETAQINALFSTQKTNYILYYHSNHIHMQGIYYPGCGCHLSSKCIFQSYMYNYFNLTVEFTVPGMYVGCYIMEALLRSSFECFYNQTCISQLQSYYVLSQPIPGTELNQLLSSQYSPNSTVQEMVDKLMIEEWNASVFYDKYYDQCQPKQCSYSYQTRNDAIYIITTLFGLVGGLITILKIFVPRLVQLLRRRKHGRIKTDQ